MHSSFSIGFGATACLFSCGDERSQTVVNALKESAQTAAVQKSQNKQNITFQLKRIELGPNQPQKLINSLKSNKSGKKISIKGLLNNLELNRDSNLQFLKNSQISSESDYRAANAYFNTFGSKNSEKEQVGLKKKESNKIWRPHRNLKKHQTISYCEQHTANVLTLDLQKKQSYHFVNQNSLSNNEDRQNLEQNCSLCAPTSRTLTGTVKTLSGYSSDEERHNYDHLIQVNLYYINMIQNKLSVIARKLVYFQFATEKYQENKPVFRGVFIKNQNLRFQDELSELYLYPMYPQLTYKGKNMFTINSERIVMYFKFIPKHKMGVIIEICQKDNEELKKLERNFSFKYAHLAALTGIEPKSGLSMVLTRPKTDSLQVKDDPQNKQVLFLLRKQAHLNQAEISKTPFYFKFSCSYMQYRVMQILLKKSLFDLSGMALVHQAKRLEQLGQIQVKQSQSKQKIKKEINQFYSND